MSLLVSGVVAESSTDALFTLPVLFVSVTVSVFMIILCLLPSLS